MEADPLAALHAQQARNRLVLIGLCVVLAAMALAASAIGALRIPPVHVAASILKRLGWDSGIAVDPGHESVLFAVRLPRVAFAILFGAALAMSGAAIQGLFRNPLADPALIGVSSGAALVTVAFIVLGVGATWLPVAAFTGGLVVTLAVQRLAQMDGRTSVTALLLAGIALNAFLNAGTGLFTFLANDSQLRSISFWTLGSLGGATPGALAIAAPFVGVGGLILWSQRRALNALLLGEDTAGHLGFPLDWTRRLVILAVAILVGVSVSSAGVIGFIGLVVPHLLRLLLGPDHRVLLPACALLGSIILVFADILSRTIAAPAEVPIGIVTAMLGAPFFLWLLHRQKERW